MDSRWRTSPSSGAATCACSTNHLLASIPDLADLCLFVDPFGGNSAAARSRAGLRAAMRWLDDGHALIVFPAGGVAHQRGPCGTPIDPPWHSTAARLAAGTDAVVVPAIIAGTNSEWFYRAGQIHDRLRTLLLGRELLRQRGHSVAVHLGERLSVTAASLDPAAMTDVFRAAVEQLGARAATSCAPKAEPSRRGHRRRRSRARSTRCRRSALVRRSGAFDVFCADAAAIPTVLRELGRLREITFRAVGEGTGQAFDLDRFDDHYLHLFVWNRDAREIAGAYRLGLTDDIVRVHGIDGLYTSTLVPLRRTTAHAAWPGDRARPLVRPRGISALLERAAAAVEGHRARSSHVGTVSRAVRPGQHQQPLSRHVAASC